MYNATFENQVEASEQKRNTKIILSTTDTIHLFQVLDRNEQELALSNLTAALCNHISGPKPSICDKKQKAIKNNKVNKNRVSSYKE